MLDASDYKVLAEYLVAHDVAGTGSVILVEPLPGGVSNTVLKITCNKGRFVLKQALGKLKVSSEWLADVERANVEKKALKFLPQLVPGITPALVHADEPNCLFIMECAPGDSVTWKSMLLDRDCDPVVARKAGGMLARIHQGSHELAAARELFGDKKFFHQLRIAPFFEFLKEKHPSLQKAIDAHIAASLDRELALVLGDYSPKNILVHNQNIIAIDFEVIHYGDPSFDTGFLTAHLFLKSVRNPEGMHAYFEVLRQAMTEYFSHIHFISREQLEAFAVQQLAWLLLARVDGKSPAEYITDEKKKQFIRLAHREILGSGMKTFEEVIGFFAGKMNGLMRRSGNGENGR